MAVATRARDLLLPLLFLPLAIPIVVGGVGASVVGSTRAATSPSSASTTLIFALALLGVLRVRRHRVALCCDNLRRGRLYRIPLPALAVASLVLVIDGLARARLLRRAERRRPGLLAADLLLPRLDRLHRLRVLRGGAWKALRHLWKRDPRADLESYVAVHQGVIFGVARAAHRLDLGEDLRGATGGSGARTSSCSSSCCSSSTARTSCCASRSTPGRSARTLSAVYALFGVVLIPVSFLAIRLAKPLHPSRGLHAARRELRRLDPRRVPRRAAAVLCSRTRSTASSSPASASTRACGS